MGTPSYMPPEQAEGRSKDVGAAADIYSLGATLYALVAGRPPFVGASNQDILMQVMLDEPVPPRQLNPKVPRDLETIALKCLDKEPSRRYASAEALADDLRRFLQHEPIAARPVGQMERGWRWCRRKPALAASLAGTVLALVLGTVVSAILAVRANFHAGRAESARRVAETKTELADAARAEAVEEKNKADAARRHAEKLAYVGQLGLAQREWQDGQCAHARNLLEDCAPELRGWEHNYLYSLFHQNQRTFRGHIDQVTSVAWSPDGQRLASASRHGTVKVWDVRTGQELLNLEERLTSVAWSPDGQRLASGFIRQDGEGVGGPHRQGTARAQGAHRPGQQRGVEPRWKADR